MADITRTIGGWLNGLTRFEIGTLDSGFTKYQKTWGGQTFFNPPELSFLESPVMVSSTDLTTSDLVVCSKARVESGITYVYAVTHTAKLLKIQCNTISPPSPNNETITLLATLTQGSPTFKFGSSIIFAGATEKIYIGHDTGLTSINFDGTGETFIGSTDSSHWIANVPRMGQLFAQFIYYTNGTNLAQFSIASNIVTNYAQLNPGFLANYQARDIRVTSDGRYMVTVISRTPQSDITSGTIDTTLVGSTDSYLVYWNGSDAGSSSFTNIPSFAGTAYYTFNNSEYSFGSDALGGCLYMPLTKELTLFGDDSPLPNAIGASGNMVGWGTSRFDINTFTRYASIYIFGQNEREIPQGLYRLMRFSATSPQTDIIRFPMILIGTGIEWTALYDFPNPAFGNGKVYFSTVEYNGVGSPAYRFYRVSLIPLGLDPTMTGATLETQTEIFSPKRVQCSEMRIYIKPTAGTSFQINLIGADQGIAFSQTVSPLVTDDLIKLNPQMKPLSACAVQLVNMGTGTTSPTFTKIELDFNYVNS